MLLSFSVQRAHALAFAILACSCFYLPQRSRSTQRGTEFLFWEFMDDSFDPFFEQQDVEVDQQAEFAS